MTSWQTPTYRALNEKVGNLVGGKTAEVLDAVGIRTVGQLLRYPPRRYISGTEMSDFSGLMVGDDVAVVARITSATVYVSPRRRLTIALGDGKGGRMTATFFAEKKWVTDYWERTLHQGARGIFIGRVGMFKDTLQLTHPDFVILDERNRVIANRTGLKAENQRAMGRAVQREGLVGMYPASVKAPTWVIADSAAMAVEVASTLFDIFPGWVVDAGGVEPMGQAFEKLHAPADLAEAEAGLRRLRFDEAVLAQTSLAYRRAARRLIEVRPIVASGDGLLAALDERLPFVLTEGQRRASGEIFADLARPHPMSRLLQGEVGSGKTVVALRAMLAAIDSGGQAALLAPTEVLARQHFRTIMSLLGDLADGVLGQGVRVALLTGSQPAAVKRATQEALASGQVDLVVGTHALLSEGVSFANLSLVVVDEQHRFGVEQRAALASKVESEPHTLVMTATPIPRTVAMTVFGDLDVSAITDQPPGREPVTTVFVNTVEHPHWVTRAWQRVAEEVAKGRQVFVVAPRIDADDMDVVGGGDEWIEGVEPGRSLTSVVALAENLSCEALKGLRVAVVHGRQPAAERDETMQAFAAGESDVLVATTVIEVGVDVPNASMMVVVDADRFGIAQLHQLRGRIGRGSHPGLCLLLAPVTDPDGIAADRLRALVNSRDGFELAEVDLQIRREGNVLGAEQSGTASALKVLRVLEDADMIQLARDIAERIASEDPDALQPWVADLLTQADTAGYWAEKT